MKPINLVVIIEERNGEYEYTQRHLVQTPSTVKTEKQIEKFCERIAKTWYGDKPDWSDDNTHYFNGGEVAARYSNHHVLTDEEFEVMNKFLN